MSRITKTELKRNELLELLNLIIYYFKNNLKVVLITVISIVFILISAILIASINIRNNKISAETLSHALDSYYSEKTGESEREKIVHCITIFKEIIEKYQHTQSTPIAYYYLGNLYYKLEDYGQSLKYYQDFVQKYPNHKLVNFVSENIAYVYESQNNLDQAIKIYEDLIKKNSDSLDIEGIKINLGRIYELKNQLDKAKDIYSQLPNNIEAKFRLSNLKETLNSKL